MITIYKEENKKLVKDKITKGEEIVVEKGSWIDITNPTQANIEEIIEKTGLPDYMLNAIFDEEETAHVEVDEDNCLIVLDAPYKEDPESGYYLTAPYIIVYNKNYFITLSRHRFEITNELFKKVKKIEPHKHARLSLHLVYRLTSLFISYLKKINILTKELEQTLHSSMKNKELFDLMDINKSLVYFSTALNADNVVLSKLTRIEEYKKYEDDMDLIEDTKIELNQAIEMCTMYREIISGMTDAFASVISNNVNNVMRVLAVITIVLSVPTLIASIFGMNFKNMPLVNNEIGFWVVIGVSIALALIAACVLVFTSKRGRKKKK